MNLTIQNPAAVPAPSTVSPVPQPAPISRTPALTLPSVQAFDYMQEALAHVDRVRSAASEVGEPSPSAPDGPGDPPPSPGGPIDWRHILGQLVGAATEIINRYLDQLLTVYPGVRREDLLSSMLAMAAQIFLATGPEHFQEILDATLTSLIDVARRAGGSAPNPTQMGYIMWVALREVGPEDKLNAANDFLTVFRDRPDQIWTWLSMYQRLEDDLQKDGKPDLNAINNAMTEIFKLSEASRRDKDPSNDLSAQRADLIANSLWDNLVSRLPADRRNAALADLVGTVRRFLSSYSFVPADVFLSPDPARELEETARYYREVGDEQQAERWCKAASDWSRVFSAWSQRNSGAPTEGGA